MGSVRDTVHGKPVVIVPFRDASGARAVMLLCDGTFEFVLDPAVGFVNEVAREASHAVCWEHRDLDDICTTDRTVYDVRLLYGGEQKLASLAREHLDYDMATNVLERERRYEVHTKVCTSAGVDVARHSMLRLVPPKMVQSLLKARAIATMALFEKCLRGESGDIGTYERELWPFAMALRQIEYSGIRIDVPYVQKMLKENLPRHEAKFFAEMAQSRDGFVRTTFNPCGTSTGRIKVDQGFNVLGIPRGPVRGAFVSRFPDGEILDFDYNAIDYRSIVSSIDDPEFRKLYDGCDDFHSRTCEMILKTQGPLQRDIVKYFSYVYIYGGSDETLQTKSKLSMEKVQQVKAAMDRKLRPIALFRQRLGHQARRDGFVMIPNGKKIPVQPDDHDGKIIGLYGQGYSAWVFEQGLIKVMRYMAGKSSRVLFTVHDSLAMDYAGEPEVPLAVQDLLENAVDGQFFRVNVKRGRTYGDATAK